jgi:phage-related protein
MAETLPAVPIAFAPNLNEETRVRRVKFGDGYEARIADGLNAIGVTTTIPYTNRTQFERNLLVNFLRAHKGMVWFWWVLPGESTPRKFVSPKWTVTRSNDSPSLAPRYDLQIDVYEVFDLGT